MTRIRIAAVSDLHGFLPDPDSLLGCDLVIVAGDICPIQDHSPAYQREWLERKFAPWLQAVSVPVVGCAGNHDIIFAPETKRFVPRLSWLYLEDEEQSSAAFASMGLLGCRSCDQAGRFRLRRRPAMTFSPSASGQSQRASTS